MRSQITQIQIELEKIPEIEMEIQKLVNHLMKIVNYSIEKSDVNKAILNLYQVRTRLESCITIIKSLIEPNDNELIEIINSHENPYIINIDQCFDNAMAILDMEFKDLKKFVDDSEVNIRNKFVVKMSVKSLREKLINYTKDLILFPIENAKDIYKSKNKINQRKVKIQDKEINVTERKVFEYILFSEVFKSAKIKGSPERKKSIISSGTSSASFTENVQIRQGRPRKPEVQEISQEPIKEIDDEFPEIFEYNEDI